MNHYVRLAALFTVLSPLTLMADDTRDVEALKALDRAYAESWVAGDADAVMALFTDDATLVPHHGDKPVLGKTSIKSFWFDPAYPPTIVPEWTREPAEVIVKGDVGILRGRARLVWEYDGLRTTIPEMNYVLIAVREASVWRIRMLTWNDDPRGWQQGPVDTGN